MPSFFTHCLSAPQGLILLVYEDRVYVRKERSSEWLQCIAFDSLIVALYSIGTDETNQQTNKFVCITKTAVEVLSLTSNKEQIQREKETKLPGRVISTKQSNLDWGGARLLILTHKEEGNQFFLWSLTDDLQPTLLLKDSTKSKLDHHSFYDYVKFEGQVLVSELSKGRYLLCSTGTDTDRKKEKKKHKQ